MVRNYDFSNSSETEPQPRNLRRGSETKQAILEAAARLFGAKGFESVTIRQIAQEAKCSHTLIHLLFKDKETLLHTIALQPLEEFRNRITSILSENSTTLANVSGDTAAAERTLLQISRETILFYLEKRALHRVFFAVGASRVDIPQEAGTLNHVRNGLFDLLKKAVAATLGLDPEAAESLQAARIYFYMLHGIGSTYDQSTESTEKLLARLSPTFDAAFRVCVSGLKQEYQ